MNSREYRQYRQWRQRRRTAWIDANRKHHHPDTEAEFLIEFASMWAPFGGATEEEILVHFGMMFIAVSFRVSRRYSDIRGSGEGGVANLWQPR